MSKFWERCTNRCMFQTQIVRAKKTLTLRTGLGAGTSADYIEIAGISLGQSCSGIGMSLRNQILSKPGRRISNENIRRKSFNTHEFLHDCEFFSRSKGSGVKSAGTRKREVTCKPSSGRIWPNSATGNRRSTLVEYVGIECTAGQSSISPTSWLRGLRSIVSSPSFSGISA